MANFNYQNLFDEVLVGFCDCTGGDLANKVVIQDHYAYVSAAEYGLSIVDVSDPTHPVQTGWYDPHPGDRFQVRDVSVAGGYAYTAIGNPSGRMIIDISNPASPTKICDSTGPGLSYAVALAGHMIYIMDDVGLNVIEKKPQGFYTPIGHADVDGESWGVTVQDNYAYIGIRGQGMMIMDITDPTHPVKIGFTATPGDAFRVAAAGTYAYVADLQGGIRVIDVSDPSSPTEVSHVDFEAGMYPVDVVVSGNYAYVASSSLLSGLRIGDISDPRHPVITGGYTSSVAHNGIVVRGRYAYLAAYNGASLRIWDISNPTLPVYVGSGETPEPQVTRLAVYGDYAYLINYFNLYIFNVSNPAQPNLIGQFTMSGRDIAVDGNTIYLASSSGATILHTLSEVITTTIGPAGGSLSSAAGDIQLSFPSGALSQTTEVTYKHLLVDQDTAGLLGINTTFDVSAVYTGTQSRAAIAPNETFSIAVSYTTTQLGAVIEDTLALYYWDGTRWKLEPTSNLDRSNHRLSATSGKFSLWAVLGETHRTYLPGILR